MAPTESNGAFSHDSKTLGGGGGGGPKHWTEVNSPVVSPPHSETPPLLAVYPGLHLTVTLVPALPTMLPYAALSELATWVGVHFCSAQEMPAILNTPSFPHTVVPPPVNPSLQVTVTLAPVLPAMAPLDERSDCGTWVGSHKFTVQERLEKMPPLQTAVPPPLNPSLQVTETRAPSGPLMLPVGASHQQVLGIDNKLVGENPLQAAPELQPPPDKWMGGDQIGWTGKIGMLPADCKARTMESLRCVNREGPQFDMSMDYGGRRLLGFDQPKKHSRN